MSGLNFNITGNNQDFLRKMQEVDQSVTQTTRAIESSGQSVDSFFRKMASGAAALAAGLSLREVISDIVQTRGEMQQLEVAFTTMLQSGEKARNLLAEAVEFAAKTPFDLPGVASGVKQLLAYGTAAEDAIETVEMLGNVSAGLSVPLNDMIYLYGTLRTQGKAFTVDIRQFAGRGVPIYEELAEVMGVTRQELNGLITEGKVGFPEVEQAFKNMTSEGGMFFNLMREQSKTITGQISNLQDSISQMLNAIGTQTEGVITSAISGLSWMVDHYREIGQVLGVIVAAYGSYRAALIAVAAAQKLVTASGSISAFLSLAKSITSAKDAMLLLNMAFKANPIGLAVSAVTTLVTVLLTLRNRSRESAEAADAARQAIADETAEVNRLVTALQDSNTGEDERGEILARLREIAPSVVKGIDDENSSLQDLNETLQEYNELRRAEASVQGFASEIGLEEAADNLSEARSRMEDERTQLLSIWTDIHERINEVSLENDTLPDHIQTLFDTILNDGMSVEERLRRIRDAYGFEQNVSKDRGSLKIFWQILDGQDFSDYDKALRNLTRAEMRYSEDKEQVQERIEATAKAMTDDLERQKEIIKELNAVFFPEDVQTPDPGDSGGETGILAVDFATQVQEAAARIDDARRKLADLKEGIIPTESEQDAAFSFAAAIKEQEKALKEAQDEYNTLIGYDPKAVKSSSDQVLKVLEEAETAEYNLAKKGVDDRIRLLEMERQRELDIISGRIDEAGSEDERSALQRLYNATAGLYDADIAAERERQVKEYNKYLQDLLQETATYQQARQQLEEEYAEKRRAMYEDESMTSFREGFGQGNRDNLDSMELDALNDLDMTFAMKDDRFKKWVKVVSDMGIIELREMLSRANSMLSEYESQGGEGVEENASRARAAIQVLSSAIDDFEDKQEDGDEDVEESKVNWTELLGVLNDASSTFTDLGNTIGGTVGTLLTSIGTLSSSVISVAAGIQAVTSATSAMEKASAILAIIAAVVQVVSFFTSAAKENTEANNAAARATMEYNNALDELADAKRLAASETIFGTDELGKLEAYNDQLRDARRQLAEIYDELTERWDTPLENVLEDIGIELPTRIVSDMRSKWQKFWGTGKNIFSFDITGLMDEYGNINEDMMEDLRDWYEQYGEGIEESQRIVIDNLISEWDRYQEALEGVRDFAKDIFGDVSSSVADLILSGTDNMEAEIDDILFSIRQKLVRSMIENAILTQALGDDLQQQIIDALAAGDIALANQLFNDGMSKVEEIIPDLIEFAENMGAVDHSSTSSSTENTVLSSVTQESFDVYSGRVANIQTHVISIDKVLSSMSSDTAMTVNLLTDISSDTSRLQNIEKTVVKIYSSVSDAFMKGIKVK